MLAAFPLIVSSTAQAAFPLTPTLRKEQNIILTCTVGPDQYAKTCKSDSRSAKTPPSPREIAFIGVETANPEYLAGATPGETVLVMVRRSLAAQLDGSNPGRAIAPTTVASQPIVNARWATMPDRWSINGYTPERSQRMGKSGSATARCSVGSQGDLLGCWIAKESPTGWGFGYATLTITTFLKLAVMSSTDTNFDGKFCDVEANFGGSEVKLTTCATH